MLVLTSGPDGFVDDQDPALRYRLPTGLAPVEDHQGRASVALTTDTDGGILALRLAARWPTLAEHERHVPLAGGRVRVVVRGTTGAGAGWADVHPHGGLLVDRHLSLGAVDADLLRDALLDGAAAVDVEVRLDIRGRTPSWPWLVRAHGPSLAQALGALVGSAPATWPDIVDAFHALGADGLTWTPTEPGPIPPPTGPDLALALAAAARGTLLDRDDSGWVLRPEPPTQLDLSLSVPTVTTRAVPLSWSFSEFLATVADPDQHVRDTTVVQPLSATDLSVINEVPLAPDGIRRIDLDVETGGPSGTVSCSFTPDGPDAQRLRFVRITAAEMHLRWRARTTVDVSGRPVVLQAAPRPTGLLLRLRSEDLGLQAVRLYAEPAVFEAVAAVAVTIGTRTVRLDADRSMAWVVGRSAPPTASVVVIDPDGREYDYGAVPVVQGTAAITAALLELRSRGPVVLEPADWSGLAYLAVQVEPGGWSTVPPDGTLVHQVTRSHRQADPRVRFRTRHVPVSADGATSPMVESPWQDGAGSRLAVVD